MWGGTFSLENVFVIKVREGTISLFPQFYQTRFASFLMFPEEFPTTRRRLAVERACKSTAARLAMSHLQICTQAQQESIEADRRPKATLTGDFRAVFSFAPGMLSEEGCWVGPYNPAFGLLPTCFVNLHVHTIQRDLLNPCVWDTLALPSEKCNHNLELPSILCLLYACYGYVYYHQTTVVPKKETAMQGGPKNRLQKIPGVNSHEHISQAIAPSISPWVFPRLYQFPMNSPPLPARQWRAGT